MAPRRVFSLSTLQWQDWVFLAAAANFVACGVISASIGGDALNGQSRLGHYFLSDHGRLTEVGHGTFLFSQVYTGVTLAVFGLAALFRGLAKKRREDQDRALARRVRSRYRWRS